MLTIPEKLERYINRSKGIAAQILFWREWQYQSKRLERFRNIHAGKRCFLIGNGPSLKTQDISRLAGEITFAANFFPCTDLISQLTPTYYCFSDWRVLKPKPNDKASHALRRIPNETISFFPIRVIRSIERFSDIPTEKTFYLNFVPTKEIWRINDFSHDVTKAVYLGTTVIIDFCLPLAIFMGIKDVYLLGCDTDYSSGYFYSSEDVSALQPPGWYQNVTNSYQIAQTKVKPLGVTIRNATRGGKLEVFERIQFESLVS